MKVEVLYFAGCPNHEALLQHLHGLLESSGASAEIELVPVEDLEAVERERFLGSPTVRIDGRDVEPGAADRDDFGLTCRLFSTPDGLRGMPARVGTRRAQAYTDGGVAMERSRLTVDTLRDTFPDGEDASLP